MKDKPRSFRKELKQPDEFVTLTERVIDYLAIHRRQALTVLAAFVAVSCLVAGVLNWRSRREMAAQGLLGQAQSVLRAEASGPEASPAAGQDPAASQDMPEEKKNALELLNRVIDQYGGSRAAQMARIFLGQVLFERGDFEGAVKAFQAFLDGRRMNPEVNGMAREGLAYACEAKGDFEKAREQFEHLSLSGPPYLRGWALLGLARNLQSLGKTDRALEVYRQLVADHPNHPKVAEARATIARLSEQMPPAPELGAPVPAPEAGGDAAAAPDRP